MLKHSLLMSAVVLATSSIATQTFAGSSFWIYNATESNTVSVVTPQANASTVQSGSAYQAKNENDGDTMTMLVAGKQYVVTDQNTSCANLPGTWEMTVDSADEGTNTREGSLCIAVAAAQCGNLGIVIQPESTGNGVTVGVKDRGSALCGATFVDWVTWIKDGVKIIIKAKS